MSATRSFMLPLLACLFVAAGCAAPPIVSVRTTADLSHSFAPPAGASVHAKVWRAGEGGRSAESDDATGAGRIVPRNLLTLEERNFLTGIEAGLARAGFDVVDEDASPAYTMLASMDTATGVYDTYRRVPVIESTTGFVNTHHGLRSYSATTTSDYIVPEKRPFVHRIVTLSALPSDAVEDGSALSPDLPGIVWRGRVVSDADVIDSALPHHIATLLESWGENTQREVKYDPEK